MAQHKKVKAAVIGCGTISKIYMENLTTKFSIVDLVGCSDLIPERSAAKAEAFGIKQMTNDEIYNDPEIEVVMNLTFPEAHYEVSKAALMAGKHVCVEKMMTVTMAEATELLNLAREKNLLFGVAPDTFLGGGWQSARKYVDDGLIGRPISIAAICTTNYNPNTPLFDVDPDNFFFPLHPGGGVPYDLGGYYLHNMINLLGPVRRVSGFGGNISPDRIYSNPHHPKYKEPFRVETETTVVGSLEFENGCVGTILFSSDSTYFDSFSIHGSDGILEMFHPNFYSGDLILKRVSSEPAPRFAPPSPSMPRSGPIVRGVMSEYKLPMLHGYLDNNRGIGLADLAYALRNNRKPRIDVELGYHAFEIIHGINESCRTGQVYKMTSRCERPRMIAPAALVATAQEHMLDD
ncbi:MAG: Gfo/Idh/MocA family protein [Saccharofermentanales bacterium]|nr:Gfo/Idh/MocA family oxidoreductase [Clostridiaceae bacterium]